MTSTLIRPGSKAKSATILTDGETKDEFGNFEETRKAVERAEGRARNTKRKTTTNNAGGNDRRFAQALHREADESYHKGDYETALVLYHRAANVCPRDGSHSAAARRTAALISSWHDPPKRLRKFLSKTKVESRMTIALCPEAAAIKAANVLRESPDFSSVNQVLSYFDEHRNLWSRSPTASNISRLRLSQSNAMLTRLKNVASTTLKKLEAAFHAGNVKRSFQYAKELLTVASGVDEPRRYEVEAHRYLALTHVMLGRHDRAVDNVARMVYLAKISGQPVLMSRALITLGKVHLSFDHLDAAARAWEHLSQDLKEPILRAWIHHEIGRCYLETGKFVKAFNMASRCLEIAEEIGSKKWILHGKLLRAQTLVKLGRFAEALEELKICARISEEEGDTPTLSYIQNLLVDLTRLLRRITFGSEEERKSQRDDSMLEKETVMSFSSDERTPKEEEEEEEEKEEKEEEEKEEKEEVGKEDSDRTERSFLCSRSETNDPLDRENRLGVLQDEDAVARMTDSTVSLRSEETSATYVIGYEKEGDIGEVETRKNEENTRESFLGCIFDNENSPETEYTIELDKEDSEWIDVLNGMPSSERTVEKPEEQDGQGQEDPEKMIEIIRVALSMSKEEVSSIEKVQIAREPSSATIDKKDPEFRSWNSREDGRRSDVGDSITKGRTRDDSAEHSL
ncbi:hypothetical protein KPH14_011324 [Odynerus spinipes]|uniref:Outer dynein arm-docking complex subunit 4 n=1 Tax=Odynerus spinipes TaxID=1348599 RepID=A0AAD9RA31_9HYME|nr:hypothetical protein KPH14_011324 [Odynerus spinipes]